MYTVMMFRTAATVLSQIKNCNKIRRVSVCQHILKLNKAEECQVFSKTSR